MIEDKDHSVIINIPRPRVLSPEPVCSVKNKENKKRLSERTIRKPSDGSLRKYSLPGDSLFQDDAFYKNELLLPYRLYTKEQRRIKRKQRLGIKLQEKYKIINTNLRIRLHVEHPLDDVIALTDVDEDYFRQLINHSSIQKNIPLYKSLRFQFHERIRMRQETGYLRDVVLNTEVSHRKELSKYESSVDKYVEQVKQFDLFLMDDYQKSIELLRNSETLVAKVNAKILELEYVAHSQFTVQSKLLGLYFMYCKQQKYGRFLYYLSPPSWRAKHRHFAHSIEIKAKGFDFGASSEEDTFNVLFEKMQNDCSNGLVKPVLYFSHPDGLLSIYETMQKHQLHHLTRVNDLEPRAKALTKMIRNLKIGIENDSAFVAEIINDTEILLNFNEKRSTQLEAKFMKILNNLFYDTVAATDVLKLQMHLEWCFEKIYQNKSSHTSMVSTAKALENMFMKYSYKLDAIVNEELTMCLKQCIKEEKETMEAAQRAARELLQFDRLEKSLLRAHAKGNANEASCLVVKRPSNRKSKREVAKPIIRASNQRQLTEAEIEYLCLFTDWTEKEDPAIYLKSLQ